MNQEKNTHLPLDEQIAMAEALKSQIEINDKQSNDDQYDKGHER